MREENDLVCILCGYHVELYPDNDIRSRILSTLRNDKGLLEPIKRGRKPGGKNRKMNSPALTIVVPSQGRPTLPRLLESLQPKYHDGVRVEIFLVGDSHGGYINDVRYTARQFDCIRFAEVDADCHAWGYPQIQYGYDNATGDYILCIGDDDVYVPNALNKIQETIRKTERVAPYLFKVRMRDGTIFWNEGGFVRGRVSTQNFCVLNIKDKLGFWWDDFAFMEATVNKYGGHSSIVWSTELIAEWKP